MLVINCCLYFNNNSALPNCIVFTLAPSCHYLITIRTDLPVNDNRINLTNIQSKMKCQLLLHTFLPSARVILNASFKKVERKPASLSVELAYGCLWRMAFGCCPTW